jgi:anti-sigma B factor antagonist
MSSAFSGAAAERDYNRETFARGTETRSRVMTIEERRVGEVTILALHGRLILDDGDVLFRQRVDDLASRGDVRLIADFTDVDYVDSAGVGLLIAKYLSVRRKGGDLKLLRLSDRSLHVLEIAHLLSVFEIFDDEEAAVRSFAAPER